MIRLKRYLKRKLHIPLSISEIIDIVLENQDLFETGLCKWMSNLYMTDKLTWWEYRRLYDVMLRNSFKRQIGVYWWEEGDIQPRIEFLKQIKN